MYVSIETQHRMHMHRMRDGNPLLDVVFDKTMLLAPGKIRSRRAASTVHVHPNRRFLYGANRSQDVVECNGKKVYDGGENSIVVYALNQQTGEPTAVQHIERQKIHPRTFHIDPGGRMLVAQHDLPVDVRDGDTVRTVPAGRRRFHSTPGVRCHVVPGGAMDHTLAMRRVYESISTGDIDGLGRILAAEFVDHEELPGLAPTRDGVIAFFRMYVAAFPDLRMTPEDLFQGGDKVVARVRASGTHTGEFMGMPPTGKRFETQLIDIIRFGDDGLAREHWGVFDQLTMLQQLGAIPAGPPA